MFSEMQKVKLSNSKIFLEEFKPEDFEEVRRTIKKSQDHCYFGDFFNEKELFENLNSRSILSNSDPLDILWIIRSKETNQVVGMAGFQPDKVDQDQTQLVWFACLDFTTKKVAATVVHMLIEYACDFHNLDSVSVFVHTGRKKHKSVARQIGLKFQRFLWKDNQSMDYYKLYD